MIGHYRKRIIVTAALAMATGAHPLLSQARAAQMAAKPGTGAVAESPEIRRGRLLFIQCRACHDLKAGIPHKVGPNLNGMLGRKAGMASGFALYSPALKAWAAVWDAALLDKWIERPSAVVPGNSMAFAGLASAKDRAALVNYVVTESSKK